MNSPTQDRLPIPEIIAMVKQADPIRTDIRYPIREYQIGLTRLSLRCFAEHGTRCTSCGLEGSFFVVERGRLVLYAEIGPGELVPMTCEDLVPRERGGRGRLDNVRTVCSICRGTHPWGAWHKIQYCSKCQQPFRTKMGRRFPQPCPRCRQAEFKELKNQPQACGN